VSLGDIAHVDSGPAFPSSMFKGPGEGVRLLRGENIEPGALRWADTRTWPRGEIIGYEHLLVEPTDLILGMDRPLVAAGLKLAPVRPSDLPALLVQRVARIRPAALVSTQYLAVALRSARFAAHLLASQTGTQLPHITLAGIRSFRIPLPPVAIQSQIASIFEEQRSVIETAHGRAGVAALRSARLRSSVLTAAFSGQLVPQDPADEPASILLERIAAARASTSEYKPTRTRGPHAKVTA
jgi:type I restriction enzyme S subunit